MKIKLVSGPPSCGKTIHVLQKMINYPGLYLFASSRVELIRERERDLDRMIAGSPNRPAVLAIHGETSRRAPVTRQIAEAVEDYRGDSHVILLITHEAMMSADLEDCVGWHIMIDEIPSAVVTSKVQVEAAAVYLERSYDLEPARDAGRSKLLVRDDAPDTRSILRDDFLNDLVVLDKRARTAQGVYVDVRDWADLRQRNRPLQWWSAWTPLQLRAFESVTIAGASYHHSILAKVTEKLFPGEIEVEHVPIAGRPRQPRRVIIHHFTRGHRGSSTFWKGAGRDCLVKVCRYLEGVEVGYWSGNEVVTDYFYGRLGGEKVSPKTEGTNSLMHHRSCAFIYSSKALPSDETLLTEFGVSREEIERAREIEDVIQFVCRGNLRDPNSTSDYRIYLYDLHQAQAVADYITEQGLGTVELVPVEEAGILDTCRPARGRPCRVAEDLRSRDERAAEKRAKDAARQKKKRDDKAEALKKAGQYRPRGRPPKSAPDLSTPGAV